MIDHLRVQNFKSLIDVSVDFEPLTILVGPNDSGKTSLLDALHTVSKTSSSPIQQALAEFEGFENLVSYKDTTKTISWNLRGHQGSDTFDYQLAIGAPLPSIQQPFSPQFHATVHHESLEVVGDPRSALEMRLGPQGIPTLFATINGKQQQQGYPWQYGQTGLMSVKQLPGFSSFVEKFGSVSKYRLDPGELRKPAALSRHPVLASAGENLANVLDSIQNNGDLSSITELQNVFKREIPTLRGFSLPPTAQQHLGKILELSLARAGKKPITIPANLGSDGSLLLLAFLALAYGNTADTILIEEPENGLYFARLKVVIDLIRRMTTGELGDRPRQVIITTYSPILLNLAKPKEVRIFIRHEDGGTRVVPMDKVENIDRLEQEFATGELWYLLGEEKLAEVSKA